MSRTSSPVMLPSAIGEAPVEVDATLSNSWIELESVTKYQMFRGILVLGAGLGHTRFRSTDMASARPLYAADDNFLARVGGGIGVAPIAIGPLRPAPYVLYTRSFGVLENTLDSSFEIGVDLELERGRADAGPFTFVVGAALTYETGGASAEFGADRYPGSFTTKGILVTFGGRIDLPGLTE